MKYVKRILGAMLMVSASAWPALSGAGAAGTHLPQGVVSGLPLSFEPTALPAAEGAEFVAHGPSYTIGLSNQGAALGSGSHVIRLEVLGARATPPAAEKPLPGVVNYFIGNDPAQWRTGVKTFAQVRYSGVYPGVDLLYYGTQGRLEYDFAVAPGASAAPIRLAFAGADAVRVDAQGNLDVAGDGHEVVFEHPVAYQMKDGRRAPVAARYQLSGGTVRFALGAYDHSKRLVIDPVLSYLSYLGGSATESIGNVTSYGASGVGNFTPAAAVDTSGNLYVVGSTYSTNFPTVGGLATHPAKYNGDSKPWVFVSKIAPDAKTLVYSTYIGGSFDDEGNAIAVDSTGSAYITGNTDSADFPVTTGAYQTVCAPTGNSVSGESQNCLNSANVNSGNAWGNAFIAKLNAAGNALVYSTFLGTGNTVGVAIAVDGSGRAYVAGDSPNLGCAGNPAWNCFPTTTGAVLADGRSGFDQEYAFVSVLNAAGSSLLYSTLFGDKHEVGTAGTSHPDFPAVGTAVAVDASGNFYLAGQTADGQLPTTTGSLQPVPGPSVDANGDPNGIRGYVAKFSAAGGASAPTLVYATYLGGTTAGTADTVSGIAADASGAYVYGFTTDNAFPMTTGAYQTTCGLGGGGTCANASFIAKLNPSGSAFVWATYFGDATGSGDGVSGTGAIAIDAAGNSYITGVAGQLLPQVNPIQAAASGGSQAFAATINATGTKLLFSTLMGGLAGSQEGSGIAVDSTGNIYVAGNSNAAGAFTTTAGVFQPTFGGSSGTGFNAFSGDGFVAKISSLTVATTTTLTATPTSATVGTAVSLTATVTPASGTGVPTGTVTFQNGSTVLGTATLNGTGQATYSAPSLAVGTYSVTAVYGGDSADLASTSTAVAVTITAAPLASTTTLTAAPTTATVNTAVVFTASVAPASGSNVPTGTVTFKDGTTTLGTATLAAGKATYSNSALTAGAHSITAAYGGDALDAASTSAAVSVTINPAIPSAPTGVTATGGNAQVTLSWAATTGATSYSIYQGTSAGGESTTAVQTGISGTTATITGLTNGTAYYFTVAAVNAGGTSSSSSEASATPAAPASTGGGGGHSGGGAMNPSLLLGLVVLAALRIFRTRKPV
jgi:hypothetical protein